MSSSASAEEESLRAVASALSRSRTLGSRKRTERGCVMTTL